MVDPGSWRSGSRFFYLLPHLVVWFGAPVGLATAVIIAAIQIHHYFVDGVIWKLRTRSVVSPLLLNIPDLIKKEEGFAPVGELAA